MEHSESMLTETTSTWNETSCEVPSETCTSKAWNSLGWPVQGLVEIRLSFPFCAFRCVE